MLRLWPGKLSNLRILLKCERKWAFLLGSLRIVSGYRVKRSCSLPRPALGGGARCSSSERGPVPATAAVLA